MLEEEVIVQEEVLPVVKDIEKSELEKYIIENVPEWDDDEKMNNYLAKFKESRFN
jgi:hypothetical protein